MEKIIEVIKKVPEGQYWSKSENFLLPLTGLSKSHKFPIKTYLFWRDYSIEDYQLIVVFSYDKYEEFLVYCNRIVFPILDKNLYCIESYDFDKEGIFILDLSEWALDIEMFLKGKYSKFSRDAKEKIVEYHTYFDKGAKIPIEVSVVIEPNVKYGLLGGVTALEYVSDKYGIPYEHIKEIGELGNIYEKEKETLNDYLITEEGSTLQQSNS